MPRRKGQRRQVAEINVVPYIDVMLVLLVIFMITAPLLTEGVSVDLPRADAKAIDPDELNTDQPLILSVDAAGQLYLNVGQNKDQPLAPERVMARAAAYFQQNQNTVRALVKADRSTAYEHVVVGMAMLQRAGAASVGLITEPVAEPNVAATSDRGDS